ncbi:OLC1v1010902C2 [Oldenlandia corymbosa var. corymbosa]|nr:OLC1v1010902C2 [Oldenlandia corymbosa var. corymbosa]
MSFDGGTSESKKTIILPAKIDFRKQERDVGHVEKYREIKPFVTVKDINLKTKPSHLPPPSRPPPVYVEKKGATSKQHLWTKDDSSCSLEQLEGNGSPPFYDVEIDGSSSMLGSATVRDVTEEAQAKIRSAKESTGQKVLQSCSKLQPLSNMKMVEEHVNKTFETIGSYKDDRKATYAEERRRTVPLAEERSKVLEIDQEIPDLVEPERSIDFDEISTKRRNGKESGLSYQTSHKTAHSFAWRQEIDYFEVVETGIPFEAIEEHKDESKFVQEGLDEVIPLVVNEMVEQKEEFKDLNDLKLGVKNNKIEVTAKDCHNEMQSEEVSKSSNQIVFQKVPKVDLKSCESDTYKKEIKMTKNPEEIRKTQNDSDKVEENQIKADMKVLEANHMRKTREKPGSTEVRGHSHATKTNVRKPKEDLDLEESIERLCEAFVQAEEINQTEPIRDERKKQDVCYEKQKNKKHKELCRNKKDQNLKRETFDLENNEKRRTEPKEDGKASHKPVVEKENQEPDASPMISAEVDVEESSTLTSASTSSTPFEACEHQQLSGYSEDAEQIKWDSEDRKVKLDEVNHLTVESESIKSFDGADDLDNDDGASLSWELDRSFGMLERTQEIIAPEDNPDLSSTLDESEPVKDVGVTDWPGEERPPSVNQDELQSEKYETGTFDVMYSQRVNQHKNDSNEAGIDIGNSSNLDKEVSKRPSQPGQADVKAYEPRQRGQKTSGVEPKIHQGISNLTSHQPSMAFSANGKVTGASLTGRLGDRGMQLNSGKHLNQNVEEKAKIMNESEIKERLQREKELEKEQLRKIEEEREREREREKDRMAVDRATLETRDRLYAEARERAERAAVERAAAEARQRAMAEARERLEKTSLEARERSLADKASTEARLRAERAAVERATLEARQRAFEKAMAERVVSEGRERVERSVSDKFFTTSRADEMRQSSSFSNSGTSNSLRYSYSSVQFGNESESPQRCKARLERYRRTAERAAKALEEKNMRDLVAQREQAERNRVAETLDAEVKRWSNGKEGNLRALLSTLQYILGAESGWQPIPLTEVITSAAVKKAYRKATLCVHPDKLQQRGASIQHKYICEKVFDLLKEAWNTFNSEER